MASPLLLHPSDPFRRKPKGVAAPSKVVPLAGCEGFDSLSREGFGLLSTSMSCAKRGITGKQVHRMMVAASARLLDPHRVS